MVRSLLLAIPCLLVACTDDDLVPGRAVAGCTECGPGALESGRFVDTTEDFDQLAASRSGHVARAGDATVAWLDASLVPARSVELHAGDHALSVSHIGLGEDGSAFVTALWIDEGEEAHVLIALAPSGRELWRRALGLTQVASISVGEQLVFVGSAPHQRISLDRLNATGSWVAALDRTSGEVVWIRDWVQGAGSPAVQVAALPAGGVAVGGAFKGVLALGGDVANTVATSDAAGFVATFDATGRATWAHVLDVERSIVTRVATGSGGELAAVTSWAADTANQRLVWFAADRANRWDHPLGRRFFDDVGPIVVDGAMVYASGSHGPEPLAFDPDRRPAQGNDAWLAAFDGTAPTPRWLRFARGTGSQGLGIAGMTSEHLIVTMPSTASADAVPAFSLGDVAVTGSGFLMGKLVR